MNYFKKITLSGSDAGRHILIANTTIPGTLIHTTTSDLESYDEVWLWATNTSSADSEVYLLWGGEVLPNDLNVYNVLAKDGYKCIVPGIVLANGYSITAYSPFGSTINVVGYVNRISTT
jgi:hypothetical protein